MHTFMKFIHNIQEGEPKKDINKLSKDHKSESILKIWSRPNPHANATQQIGKPKFFGFFFKILYKKSACK